MIISSYLFVYYYIQNSCVKCFLFLFYDISHTYSQGKQPLCGDKNNVHSIVIECDAVYSYTDFFRYIESRINVYQAVSLGKFYLDCLPISQNGVLHISINFTLANTYLFRSVKIFLKYVCVLWPLHI